MEDAVTPLPRPLTTPPLTTTYFIVGARRGVRRRLAGRGIARASRRIQRRGRR